MGAPGAAGLGHGGHRARRGRRPVPALRPRARRDGRDPPRRRRLPCHGHRAQPGPRARGGAGVRPAIFLTGATGFLGTEVLARLLEAPECDVLALVRADDDAAAERRLDEVLATLWEDPSPYRDRVTAVRGDVTSPGLGMGIGARRHWLPGGAPARPPL